MTFKTIDQKDEETWHDQQEDKDKDNRSEDIDKDKDNRSGNRDSESDLLTY